jgi:hypothetical protein
MIRSVATIEDLLGVGFDDRVPRLEVGLVALDHAVALLLDGVLKTRVGVADGRPRRDVRHRRIETRRLRQRNRVVTSVARAHAEELGDVAAARAAIDPDLRHVAIPGRGFPLEPADAVIGVLHAGRVRRFGREGQVDGDDEQAAPGEGAVHGFLGKAVLGVPGAAVEIEDSRKRSRAIGLIDPGHEHPPGLVAPELHVAHRDLEFRRGVIGRDGALESTPRCRVGHREGETRDTQCAQRLEELPTSRSVAVHAGLLRGLRDMLHACALTICHRLRSGKGKRRGQSPGNLIKVLMAPGYDMWTSWASKTFPTASSGC